VEGKENCRSLGFARDDKGEGSADLSSRYRGMDRAAAGYPRFSSPWVGRGPMIPPVGMTIPSQSEIFYAEALAGTTKLSSRPERSAVEGPAVSFPGTHTPSLTLISQAVC